MLDGSYGFVIGQPDGQVSVAYQSSGPNRYATLIQRSWRRTWRARRSAFELAARMRRAAMRILEQEGVIDRYGYMNARQRGSLM